MSEGEMPPQPEPEQQGPRVRVVADHGHLDDGWTQLSQDENSVTVSKNGETRQVNRHVHEGINVITPDTPQELPGYKEALGDESIGGNAGRNSKGEERAGLNFVVNANGSLTFQNYQPGRLLPHAIYTVVTPTRHDLNTFLEEDPAIASLAIPSLISEVSLYTKDTSAPESDMPSLALRAFRHNTEFILRYLRTQPNIEAVYDSLPETTLKPTIDQVKVLLDSPSHQPATPESDPTHETARIVNEFSDLSVRLLLESSSVIDPSNSAATNQNLQRLTDAMSQRAANRQLTPDQLEIIVNTSQYLIQQGGPAAENSRHLLRVFRDKLGLGNIDDSQFKPTLHPLSQGKEASLHWKGYPIDIAVAKSSPLASLYYHSEKGWFIKTPNSDTLEPAPFSEGENSSAVLGRPESENTEAYKFALIPYDPTDKKPVVSRNQLTLTMPNPEDHSELNLTSGGLNPTNITEFGIAEKHPLHTAIADRRRLDKPPEAPPPREPMRRPEDIHEAVKWFSDVGIELQMPINNPAITKRLMEDLSYWMYNMGPAKGKLSDAEVETLSIATEYLYGLIPDGFDAEKHGLYILPGVFQRELENRRGKKPELLSAETDGLPTEPPPYEVTYNGGPIAVNIESDDQNCPLFERADQLQLLYHHGEGTWYMSVIDPQTGRRTAQKLDPPLSPLTYTLFGRQGERSARVPKIVIPPGARETSPENVRTSRAQFYACSTRNRPGIAFLANPDARFKTIVTSFRYGEAQEVERQAQQAKEKPGLLRKFGRRRNS